MSPRQVALGVLVFCVVGLSCFLRQRAQRAASQTAAKIKAIMGKNKVALFSGDTGRVRDGNAHELPCPCTFLPGLSTNT